MGGNALSTPSVRLEKARYERVAQRCSERLKAQFPGRRVYVIESYRAKPDFGDLDILVESTGFDPHHAAAALGALEVVRNGPVTSVGVLVEEAESAAGEVFQVDLISMPPEAFAFASCYFRFSDMGNLLGRVAHALGTSLRHDGLVFPFREGDYQFREIVLTRNFAEALAFLGYDAGRYFEGFEDLEAIFQYVTGGAFFSRDIYLLSNRNAKARVRDRKRPTYTGFLTWCDARPHLEGFAFPSDKRAWLGRIAAFFPAFQAAYDQAQADLARERLMRDRFNGRWVGELTGLQGKALGVLMRRFRDSFGSPQELQRFVLDSDHETLSARIRTLVAAE